MEQEDTERVQLLRRLARDTAAVAESQRNIADVGGEMLEWLELLSDEALIAAMDTANGPNYVQAIHRSARAFESANLALKAVAAKLSRLHYAATMRRGD